MALPIFNIDNITEISDFYTKNGLVCIKLLNESECNSLIYEQWEKILLDQPWSTTTPLGIDLNDPNFIKKVTQPLDIPTRKKFENGWTFHRGFGACCDPQVFHLPKVWEIRQNPKIYQIATKLTGISELWVDINRSIQKLPGQGENEFLHWDFNPFFTDFSKNNNSICGKVCYTNSNFIGVLGTHTSEFFDEFKTLYEPIYGNLKGPKLGLHPDKSDPLNLFNKRINFEIPAGCVIFWNERLLHGTSKSKLNEPIQYGCYLGYFPAKSKSKYKKITGINERIDRIFSYNNNCAPLLWPSLDKIHYYPFRFKNFPHILQKYIKKIPANSPQITTRITTNGVTVTDLIPLVQEHSPPPLTELGKKLLGLNQY